MPKNEIITSEKMENILFLLEKGLNQSEAASITGVSAQTASRVKLAYNAAKDGDIAELNKFGIRYAEWASAKFGIKPVAEEKTKPKNDNTAQAVVALLNCINDLTAAVERIDNRLSAIQMTQQGVRGELSEHTKKLIESLNINGDILTKEHGRMIDILGGIKMNTRKRGGGGE